MSEGGPPSDWPEAKELCSMRNIPARFAVRLAPTEITFDTVLRAAARLALFNLGKLPLQREEVEDLSTILVDFLAEVNDASPKL